MNLLNLLQIGADACAQAPAQTGHDPMTGMSVYTFLKSLGGTYNNASIVNFSFTKHGAQCPSLLQLAY